MIAIAPLLRAATVTDYTPTRDTYMRGVNDPDPLQQQLHGTSASGRASKSYLDFYIADFDRAAINAAIAGQLGHALTIDDMANVKVSLNLFSNDFEGYQPTALSRPAVFMGMQDWVEGSDTTLGATKNYAVFDPANPANNRTWKNVAATDVQSFFDLTKVENAAFEEWGGQPFSYRSWLLDDNVGFTYLTDPLALGLFLNASDAGNVDNIDAQYSNTETYSRERADTSVLPFLEVTVVPEPSAMSIFALGALLLARRHPRSRRL